MKKETRTLRNEAIAATKVAAARDRERRQRLGQLKDARSFNVSLRNNKNKESNNNKRIYNVFKTLLKNVNERAASNGNKPVKATANILAASFANLKLTGASLGTHGGMLIATNRTNLPFGTAGIDIILSKNVLERLRALHTESSNVIPANGGDGVEYAGIIKIRERPTNKDLMPAQLILQSFKKGSNIENKPEEELHGAIRIVGEITSGQSMRVVPNEEIVNSRITFHTHPTPRQREGQTEYNKDTQIFTMPPSVGDLEFYLNNWPKTQANIIVDEFGFYVVDVIEAENKGMFLTPQGSPEFNMRVKVICSLWETAFFSKPKEDDDNTDPINPDVQRAIEIGWPKSNGQVVNNSTAVIRDMEKYTRDARFEFGAAQGLLFPNNQVEQYNAQLTKFGKITGVSVKYYSQEQITNLTNSANRPLVKQTLPTVTLTSRTVLAEFMLAAKEMTRRENKSQQVVYNTP